MKQAIAPWAVMARGQSIFIPVANRAEEVEVQVDNLPAVNDVLDLLKAEEAPLHIWLDLAVREQLVPPENVLIT